MRRRPMLLRKSEAKNNGALGPIIHRGLMGLMGLMSLMGLMGLIGLIGPMLPWVIVLR